MGTEQLQASDLSRRAFLKLSTAAAVGMAVAGAPASLTEGERAGGSTQRLARIEQKSLPLYQASGDECPPLSRRYPWIRFGEKPLGHLQIAYCAALPDGIQCDRASGSPGERFMVAPSGGRVIPWSPMFPRPTRVYAAGPELSPRGAARLFIKDEGSVSSLLYGNKIRKYEYTLPNLACSGVRTIRTHGAYGSNHCAYLTLAARYGRYGTGHLPLEVELFLYPQELSENVITKLRLLTASGARLRFLDGDASAGFSILAEELRSRSFEDGVGYVAPGGSSPLSVLGHVDALLELAEQVGSADCPLEAPPDYIFVPLGSGATAMGLVLGCYLLGWKTKVVGTCSQDKGRLARLAVNGDAETPFLQANAASLLEKSLKWMAALGLQPKHAALPSARELMASFFACDSETWHPAYGKVTPEVAREAQGAGEAGLFLDHTFTAKSFHTLTRYAKAGVLKKSTALFWNTYQRFPLESILPQEDSWRLALPDPLRQRIETFEAGRRSAA